VWERFGRRTEVLPPGCLDGPFEGDTFAEDFDFSLAAFCLGHRVVFEPRAVSQTAAPRSALALLNQRYRWERGSLQVLRKLLQRPTGSGGRRHPQVLRWVLLTYAVDLLLMPVWLALCLPFMLGTLFDGSTTASTFASLLLLFCAANAVLTLATASVHGDQKRLFLLVPLVEIYQTFVVKAILLFVCYDELRRAPMRWS
jgi:cellulose synthase/poly-beta-1,6-N-acetylglucosamine synthase-like glycosyltransferase